jgi:hypothetical protein
MIFRPAFLAVLRWTATVTTIIITIGVIILRIAMRVGSPMDIADFSFIQCQLIIRVQTVAVGTVIVVVICGGAAAVSTVPITSTVVIFIVARLVSLPDRFVTWFVARSLEIRV